MDNKEMSSFVSNSGRGRFMWKLSIVWLVVIIGTAALLLSARHSTVNPENVAKDEISTSTSSKPGTSSSISQNEIDQEEGVFTYVCADLKVAPSRVQFQCRDGEDFIDDIVWSEWKSSGASGKGMLNQSDCSFGCKSPKYSKYPVTVKLSSPIKDGKIVYFGRLDYLYVSPSGQEYPGVWDPTAVHDGRVISEDW